jgi:hypothetical protein
LARAKCRNKALLSTIELAITNATAAGWDCGTRILGALEDTSSSSSCYRWTWKDIENNEA